METNQTSSFKRKPLSDCTNTVSSHSDRRKLPKSSVSDRRNPKPPKSSISIPPDSTQSKTLKSSISIPFNQIDKPRKLSVSIAPNSKTLNNPPKISVSIPAVHSKPQKLSISIPAGDNNPRVITTSSSPKSIASSGSGFSLDASRAPPSDSDIGDHGMSEIPVSQGQSDDAKRRLEKGKMVVDTPIIEVSNPFPPVGLGDDHLSRADATHDKNLNTSLLKDKGKTVVEAPGIWASDPVTPHAGELVSSSSASDIGDHGMSGIPISQGQSEDAKRRLEKGKMVVDTPNIEVSNPFPPAGLGDDHLSRADATHDKNLNTSLLKDKGKTVVEAPGIWASDPATPHAGELVSSSSASDDRHDGIPEPRVSQSLRLDAKTRIDKGKMVMETPIIQIPKPFTPSTLQLSSSAASGSSHLATHGVIQSNRHDERPQKDKGKIVLEDSSIETADPVTPVAARFLSASGARDQAKTNSTTVYGQRRYSLRRQKVGLTSAPLSCRRKKMKLKGVEFEDGDEQRIGSRSDPLPLHKKKQSRNKNKDAMHGMPQDEVERLKSYYADIDAFELPEEVASEDDLD